MSNREKEKINVYFTKFPVGAVKNQCQFCIARDPENSGNEPSYLVERKR
jgi:hypothetical protein